MKAFKEQVPEFEIYEHSLNWHIIAGIIGGALIAWGILSGNYLFAIFLALASAALIIKDSRVPRSLTFEIDAEGVLFGSKKWQTGDIKGYAVLPYDAERATIVIVPKGKLQAAYPLRVTSRDPKEAIKGLEALGLKETAYEESLLDLLIRLLRL